jgi:hypothetical protein
MAEKIKYRYATAMYTADRLGVPRSRAAKLIKLVDSLSQTDKKNGHKRSKSTGSLKQKTSKMQTRAKLSKAAR